MSNFFVAGAAAMTSNKDDWETPQALFDELNAIHHFTLDPCSTHENAKGATFEGSKGTCQVLDSGCDAGVTDYYVCW